MTWTANESPGLPPITGYRIERSLDRGATWQVLVADTGNRLTSWTETGIPANEDRHYRVAAINRNGVGAYSEVRKDENTRVGPPPPSTDATLATLALRHAAGVPVELSPTFDPATLAYTASVDFRVETVTVAAAANDGAAGVAHLDGGGGPLADADGGAPGFQVALPPGRETAVRVRVTAEDGAATSTYAVTVARAALPERPVGSDARVEVGSGERHFFAARDFGRFWAPGGAGLAAVRIVTLPNPDLGRLLLVRTPVTAGQVVSREDLDLGRLRWVQSFRRGLSSLVPFTFRVGDGVGESAAAYTMTVGVRPAVAVKISGTARSQELLTAELVSTGSNPEEIARFNWQWYRHAPDGSAVPIAGATEPTYRLRDEDAGRRVSVAVILRDSIGAHYPYRSAPYPEAPDVVAPDTRRERLWAGLRLRGKVESSRGTGLVSYLVDLETSHPVWMPLSEMKSDVFTVERGRVVRVQRLNPTRARVGGRWRTVSDRWRLEVETDAEGATADTLIALADRNARRACSEAGALCTVDGRRLGYDRVGFRDVLHLPRYPKLEVASFGDAAATEESTTVPGIVERVNYAGETVRVEEQVRRANRLYFPVTLSRTPYAEVRIPWRFSGAGSAQLEDVVLPPQERYVRFLPGQLPPQPPVDCDEGDEGLVCVERNEPAPVRPRGFVSLEIALDEDKEEDEKAAVVLEGDATLHGSGNHPYTFYPSSLRFPLGKPVAHHPEWTTPRGMERTRIGFAAGVSRTAEGLIQDDGWDDRDEPPPAGPADARERNRLTVEWVDRPPLEHDGSPFTFSFEFSEALHDDYSFETMRDYSLDISQGGVYFFARDGRRLTPQVRRTTPGSNRGWTVTVTPHAGDGLPIHIRLGPSPACTHVYAMCTNDGRLLGGGDDSQGVGQLFDTVVGPPGFFVRSPGEVVQEAPGATAEFEVVLAGYRAPTVPVTVDFATEDGSDDPDFGPAEAGEDYEATSGTLTFAPGEMVKTVSVRVLDDDHDEGWENFTLRLSNPSGVAGIWISDDEGIATIANDDAMPRAWLARFGRTVAEQVVEAVEGRFSASRAAGAAVTLAGERIGWSGAGSGADELAPGAGDARADAAAEAEARSRLAAMTAWLKGTEAADGEGRRAGDGSRAVTPRELLTGSSFALTGEARAGGTVSLWGRGAVSRFDGREPGAGGAGDLTLDGEVTSVMLGADWMRARWTAGLLVSRSVGEGGYRGASAGSVEGTLTGLYPYGRYLANDRVTLWGIAGYGAGELVLTPEDQDPMRTDMDLAMGALGLRGVALEAPAEGGVELAVKTDAMAVRTTSEKVDGMEAAEATVTRLRLGLEGSWRGLEAGGAELVPRLEVGVRHDGGDAETGFGLDLGGGLAWTHAPSGLSAELRGRGLLTHESRGFRDRGLSGSFAWAPEEDPGRGPSLTLTQTAGASAAGGADALLGQRHLAGLGASDDVDELANRRLELRLGYGFPAFGDRFTSTPELGLGLAEGSRDYRLGWLLGLARGGAGALELTLEATRGEPVGANDNIAPEHGVRFGLTARW